MIFAFLYGLSMDYEVFMVSRMREAYDETGDTKSAIALGLARTGKLVTSAALVLMFAFFVLSTSPGVDVKQFGIGLAAGIIFDATVIRALLVPSIMQIAGDWNWWLPRWAGKMLFVRPSPRGRRSKTRGLTPSPRAGRSRRRPGSRSAARRQRAAARVTFGGSSSPFRRLRPALAVRTTLHAARRVQPTLGQQREAAVLEHAQLADDAVAATVCAAAARASRSA